MVENTSYMFLTGPSVVKSVTGETVDQEQLGGASVHATKSGVAHFCAASEEEGIADIRRLLSFIPQNNMEKAPVRPTSDQAGRVDDALNSIIPDNPNKAYDMYGVIGSIVDDGDFFEVHKDFAKNIITGFAHMGGRSVGYKTCDAPLSLEYALQALYDEQIRPAIAQGLSAAVYTQLSDVEDECNGFVTYDRKVVKLPKQLVREISLSLKD